MKNNPYISQIFNEGLGPIFFQKPYGFINKHIKNKIINKIFKIILITIYLLFILTITIAIFILNYPL